MTTHNIIITIIILLIVCLQVGIYVNTLTKINVLTFIFRKYTYYLSNDKSISYYSRSQTGNWIEKLPSSVQKLFSKILFTSKTTSENIPVEIFHSINTYLTKNKGAVNDFNLMKDIVERNCETLEEEINAQTPIPLYMGLMGTMLGIVIGLFTMPGISDSNFENSIDLLIGGVKIAMISSALGVLLTTLSSWSYKRSKTELEKGKNKFYTFLQTELLPDLSDSSESIVRKFEKVIVNFSKDFSENAKSFNTNLEFFILSMKNMDQVAINFKQLTKQIEALSLMGLTRNNLDILQRFSNVGSQIEKFTDYLSQINSFVEQSRHLNRHLALQLEKTNEIEKITLGINQMITTQDSIVKLLEAEILSYHERKKMLSISITDTDTILQDGLDQLKSTVNTVNKGVIESVVNIDAKFEQLFSDIHQKINRIIEDENTFNEIKKIDNINKNLEELILTIKQSNESTQQILFELHKTVPPPKEKKPLLYGIKKIFTNQ